MTGFEITVLALGVGLLLGLRAVIGDFWRWWRNERLARRPGESDAEAWGDVPYVPASHAGDHAAAAATRKPQSEATE